jgi:hypothetical protein
MPPRLFAIFALLCLLPVLRAQSEAPARHEVYGGYTYLSNTFNGVPGSQQSLNGWDASLAFPSWHRLRFKIDTYGYRGTNLGAPQHALFIVAGGQYTWRFHRESIFGEALFGDVGLNHNWGPNQALGATASFAMLFGGGLDTSLSKHFAYRVGGGYQYTNFALGANLNPPNPYRIPGLPTNFGRVSSGLVWRF